MYKDGPRTERVNTTLDECGVWLGPAMTDYDRIIYLGMNLSLFVLADLAPQIHLKHPHTCVKIAIHYISKNIVHVHTIEAVCASKFYQLKSKTIANTKHAKHPHTCVKYITGFMTYPIFYYIGG